VYPAHHYNEMTVSSAPNYQQATGVEIDVTITGNRSRAWVQQQLSRSCRR